MLFAMAQNNNSFINHKLTMPYEMRDTVNS